MLKLILSTIMFATIVSATELKPHNGCVLSQEGAVSVGFEAYKTPAKIGVNATFDSVVFTPAAQSGNNFREIFVGSTAVIDTKSVNSNNKERDNRLMSFFFDKMNSQNIKAKIVDIKSDTVIKGKPKTGEFFVEISMNGVTKTVPMKFSFDAGELSAHGVIDILDFSANKALEAISKECYTLHEGKTWSSVTIAFNTKIKFELCYVKK